MYLCKLGTSLHDENFLERDDVPFVVCLGKNTFGDDVRKYSWISVSVEKECGWFCLWPDQAGGHESLFCSTWEGSLFSPRWKKHFLDAEASLAQGPGHRRSLRKSFLAGARADLAAPHNRPILFKHYFHMDFSRIHSTSPPSPSFFWVKLFSSWSLPLARLVRLLSFAPLFGKRACFHPGE